MQGRPAIEIRKKIDRPGRRSATSSAGEARSTPRRGTAPRRPATVATADDEPAEKRTVVVVQNGETTIGLLVDQLIGMQEVVLKSLEKNFRSIPGLSGASILGDGRVSLILDLDAVIDMVARRPARKSE